MLNFEKKKLKSDTCVSCISELTSHSFVCLFLPLNKRQLLLFCNNHKIFIFVISEKCLYITILTFLFRIASLLQI